MRILLASTSSGSHGGGEISLLYLGQALRDMGHVVGLWVSDHERMTPLADQFSQFGEVIRASYVNTYDLKGRSVSSYLHRKNQAAAIETWRGWNPDVVHINKQNLEDGLDLLSAAKKCGIPNVCFIHMTQTASYLEASHAQLRDLVSRLALRNYGSILATAGDSRLEDLVTFTGLPVDRMRCIYNGTSDPRLAINPEWRAEYRARLDLDRDTPLAVMTARLTAQKDPCKFLDIAKSVHANRPDIQFLWIGGGDLEEFWDEHVCEHNMGSYVRRIGWQDDVRPWLAAADAYVHSAAYEGMPFAIIEALSMGLPCYLKGELIDQIKAFTGDDVCRLDDTVAFQKMLFDPANRQLLGQRARGLYERQFRVETMAENFSALYEEVLHA